MAAATGCPARGGRPDGSCSRGTRELRRGAPAAGAGDAVRGSRRVRGVSVRRTRAKLPPRGRRDPGDLSRLRPVTLAALLPARGPLFQPGSIGEAVTRGCRQAMVATDEDPLLGLFLRRLVWLARIGGASQQRRPRCAPGSQHRRAGAGRLSPGIGGCRSTGVSIRALPRTPMARLIFPRPPDRRRNLPWKITVRSAAKHRPKDASQGHVVKVPTRLSTRANRA